MVRQVLRDLARRRTRSLLTLLGIAFGVAALVAIVSTSRNLAVAQARAYDSSAQADLTYWVWDASDALARPLLAVPNVSAVELRNTYYTRVQLDRDWFDIYIIGVEDLSSMAVSRIELLEGNYPSAGEILVEGSARDLAPLEVGDTIIYRSGPDHVERPLRISGFARSPAQPSSIFLNLVRGYMPAAQVRQILDISGSNQLLVRLDDYGARFETIAEINRVLDKRNVQHGEPQIRDPNYFEGKRELDALIQVMYAFSGIGLLISSFLVANTLSAIVAEQTREIGIMKSIGGTRRHILSRYLVAGALLGVAGTGVGLLLGTALSWVLLGYAGWALNVDVGRDISGAGLALGGGVGLTISVVGTLGPAGRASRLLVAEAIGSHGITASYQLAWLDGLLARLGRVPPLVAMAARNLARRSARNVITICFTAAATASLLAALSTSRSVNLAIEGIFDTYRADAWIWLNEYVSTHFAGSLRAMDEVERAEAWISRDAWVDLAPVRLWGLPADTTLYAPDIVKGRWYDPSEPTAMVISTDLAESQGIAVGDRVQVDVGETLREFEVVGLTVDNAIFLGGATAGKAFVPRETIESMLQLRGFAYFYALSLTPEAQGEPEAALNRIERRFRYLRPVTESAQRDMESAGEQSRLLSISLYAMTILIAIAGGLGVANTLTLNVLERRREIGVMRAIGASNRNLIQLFLTEGVIMGLLSWILGILIAYPAGRLLLLLLEGVLFEIPFVFPPGLVLVGGAFSTLLAVAASLLPALGAAQMSTQDALRYE